MDVWSAAETCVKNDEFCIKNEKSFIKNETTCIKTEEFCIKNDEFCRMTVGALSKEMADRRIVCAPVTNAAGECFG